MAIRTKLDAVSEGTVSFTANGKKLTSILKELPNDEIILDIKDSLTIDIRTKSKDVKGHYTLIGTSTEEYPDIPVFDERDSIEIEQSLLREMIKKVVYAASHDTIKPVFNGIFFILENNREITGVATDSRRLSMITRKVEGESDFDFKDGFIIPLKTVTEIFRLLEPTGRCRFSCNEKQCFFKIGNSEIISRVVDGQFPNYKHVIPADHIMDVVIETKKLLESVRRTMIFTKNCKKNNMQFQRQFPCLEASTPELGEAEEELDVDNSSSDSITIGVNAQFFIECLKEIDSFNKVWNYGTDDPITIRPKMTVIMFQSNAHSDQIRFI
jgi:DNA polymerase-3 subunit beta